MHNKTNNIQRNISFLNKYILCILSNSKTYLLKNPALILLFFIVISCNKETNTIPEPPQPEAFYKIILTMNWSSPPLGVPANAHFTRLIGMVHSKDSFLWKQKATIGLEFLAEVGSNGRLNNEIDSMIARQKALERFGINPPTVNGSIDSLFRFTTDYSCFSFASMIAPSPDWFIGINKYDLLVNNQWVIDKSVDLFVYDAGTEEGDVFGYNNLPTTPQQNISILNATNGMVLANGNQVISKIGTIRFIKN